ncbi:putative Lysyl endopeptidase [Verrucomicrobia bacterium]|nr:putative Lysyl endopeptidase [Verrucomicrobiota bacterium]
MTQHGRTTKNKWFAGSNTFAYWCLLGSAGIALGGNNVIGASSAAKADAVGERPEIKSAALSIAAGPAQGSSWLPALSGAVLEVLKQPEVSHTKGRLQIGVARSLEPAIVVNAATAPAAQWTVLTNGWRAWSVSVTSSGALALRVHLEGVMLPPGAQVLVFDPANPSSAPPAITAQALKGQPDVWSGTVFSDQAMVQCQVPPGVAPGAVSFSITQVSHLYLLPPAPNLKQAGACELDVSCYPAWLQDASGVARMSFVDQGNTYVCTGCLLAANDPNNTSDYFLTANHCIGNQALASTIELFWFYQTSSCNGPPPDLSSVPTTSGADLLATSTGNDFTFLRLRQAAPSGAHALAWSTNTPNVGDPLVGIHHPTGDYKRISFGSFYASDPDFWAVQWSQGVTEFGSSGSPLINANHQVIGQLNGGFDGPGSSCQNPSDPDQYGRFDLTYPAIKQWIDPNGSGPTNPVTNQVTFVRGTYMGLFYDGGTGVEQQSSGIFTLTTTATGRFSGRLELGNASYSITGQFNSDGSAQPLIKRRNLNALTVQLQLDPQDPDEISGTVSDGTFTAQLSGERAVYDGRTSIAPEAGQFTMVIPGAIANGGDPSVTPGGDGYATVTVNKAGMIVASGMLADGTHFAQSATVSKSANWPFYVALYGGQGSALSGITFSDATDFTGALSWIKPAITRTKYYPNGFTAATTITGAGYTRPQRGTPVLNLSSGTVSLSGNDPSVSIQDSIAIDSNNRVTFQSDKRSSLTFSTGNGMFSGHVLNPGTSTMIPFSGVVLQNQNTGMGFFLGTDQSGEVVIGQ